jgi:aspartyl/asparaginyl beta-hydroxylase (cupin superfamily)
MEKYNLTPTSENPTSEEFQSFKANYNRFYEEVFPNTSKAIKNFYVSQKGKITNISIYKLEAGTVIPVHTNYDPHILRCHMGLIVPEGDIGIMVEGERRQWEIGKFFAFDSMRPHTVWNKTPRARYVLSVDCYRATDRYEDVVAVHRALVDLRMKESKFSLGLSGGRSQLKLNVRKRYASEHEQHQ